MISQDTKSRVGRYLGRFAPTPSGPLHLGSLVTAVASYLAARHAGGSWLLRIDDLDRARCPRGMESRILRQLEAHGLTWDEAPRRQTAHLDDYRAAFEELSKQELLYLCTCTRRQLKQLARPGPDGPVYPGTCRTLGHRGRGSWRIRVNSGQLCFVDGMQGRQCRELDTEVGDVVVRRGNGEFAYQLACAVDEHAQSITDVVRGADLLGSTFQQQFLMGILGLHVPRYAHLPVLVDKAGRKLSKQNHAAPISEQFASENLWVCLSLLGEAPDLSLRDAAPKELLRWAVEHWSAARLPRGAQIAETIAYNAVQQRTLPRQ